MIRAAVDTPVDGSPEEFRAEYDALLAETIEEVGIETVQGATDVERTSLAALLDGGHPELTLDEAAAILGTDPELPDASAIETEARDILLFGMSTAVLDVEALAAGVDDSLEPKEIQQKVEGRQPMTLDQYALLHAFIERRKG